MRPIANHPNLPADTLLTYGKVLADNKKLAEARLVADRLSQRVNEPGLFLTRSAAKQWMDSIQPVP